jgi:hypothetical protein
MRYDAGTELLAIFEHTTANHISDHIREWRRRKSLIKVPVPPTFLLEWFLKSLVPQLSKDVATSRVFSEEDTIMRAQQFELIYSQSGLLYNIFPDAPRSILDKTRQRARLASPFCLHHLLSSPLSTVIHSNHMVSFLLSSCS